MTERERGGEAKGGRVLREYLGKGWEGKKKLVVQASSQFLGPPGTNYRIQA